MPCPPLNLESQAAARVLVVDDDPELRQFLRQELELEGYCCDTAAGGAHALTKIRGSQWDLVVLDWTLPDFSGVEVCRRMRATKDGTPVLMLTARDDVKERVEALDAGADDYLTKPFHTEELLARIRALIRRASGLASAVLSCGPVTLDTRSARVQVDGQPLALTSHEFKLLAYLMHHPHRVLSRADLTEHLYAQDFERDSNTIEVFVARLRKKLPAGMIETVRGLGYRLVAAPTDGG